MLHLACFLQIIRQAKQNKQTRQAIRIWINVGRMNDVNAILDSTRFESKETCMEDTRMPRNEGIRRLVEKGREAFRISENLDFYSEKDFRIAEKKFIKLCIIAQKC